MEPIPPTRIDPATEIGWTALRIRDLTRSLQFYTEVLGFAVLEHRDEVAVLGAGSVPVLILVEGATLPRPQHTTGLFHFAMVVPSRPDLGRALRQLAITRYPLSGYADHLVSEALYLSDPDGNGIEIYRDRPRSTWRWHAGQVQMASDPIDLDGLLGEAGADDRPYALPTGTHIGHMHLQVGDLAQAEAFYSGLLGFDVVAHWPGALFVSAGGYHHHIGLNTWQSRNAPPPPANAAGLRAFTIVVPTDAAQEQVMVRLQTAAVPYTEQEYGMTLRDPWRHTIVVTRRANLAAAVALLGRDVYDA